MRNKMLTKKRWYMLLPLIVVLMCLLFVSLGPSAPIKRDSSRWSDDPIHFVGRFDYGDYPFELAKSLREFKGYEPPEPCSSSDALSSESSAASLFRIAAAKSSGFQVALLKVRLFKNQALDNQVARGILEIAIFNPCLESIAVPVAQVDNLKFELLKRATTAEVNRLMFLTQAADKKGEPVLGGIFALAFETGRPESYRVLQQNESVLCSVHFEIKPISMSREPFLEVARDMTITAACVSMTIHAVGDETYLQTYVVPYDRPPLSVEVDD
jgi:hypothetical protein